MGIISDCLDELSSVFSLLKFWCVEQELGPSAAVYLNLNSLENFHMVSFLFHSIIWELVYFIDNVPGFTLRDSDSNRKKN